MNKPNNKDAWDTISESYQDRYRISPHSYYYGPLCPDEDTLQLLGDVAGKHILEIGSGAGQNSMYLAHRGAICTALDISQKQIEHGQKLASELGVDVTFLVGNFEELDAINDLETEKFDLVVSSYAIQYAMDQTSLEKIMKDVYRLLKPGGKLVFSLDHPIRAHGWWDQNDNFVIDNYFDHAIKTWDYDFPETSTSAKMTGSFKTLSDYTDAVLLSGLNLIKILEPEPIRTDQNSSFGTKSRYGENAPADPFSYEHLARIPGTVIFVGQK